MPFLAEIQKPSSELVTIFRISHQFSRISHQLFNISHQLLIFSHQIWELVTNYFLVTNYEELVAILVIILVTILVTNSWIKMHKVFLVFLFGILSFLEGPLVTPS